MAHEADVSPAELYLIMLTDENILPSAAATYNQHELTYSLCYDKKKILIDWLFEIGEKFKQSNLTIHIAIAYLERAFSCNL